MYSVAIGSDWPCRHGVELRKRGPLRRQHVHRLRGNDAANERVLICEMVIEVGFAHASRSAHIVEGRTL